MFEDDYDIIAEYYGRMQEDIVPSEWARKVALFVDRFCTSAGEGEDGKKLLVDLGCGDGRVTSVLASDFGFDTIGVDISEGMLAIAHDTAPDILWLNQDITEMELYGAADVFVSLLDTVNHITDPDGIDGLFASVAKYCVPGGVFIFDAGTRCHFEKTLGNNVFYQDHDDFTLLWANSFEGDESVSELTLFYSEDGEKYLRADTTIEERFYEAEFFSQIASRHGLELVLREKDDDGEREFFVFRRIR